jgi:uncharacterized protein
MGTRRSGFWGRTKQWQRHCCLGLLVLGAFLIGCSPPNSANSSGFSGVGTAPSNPEASLAQALPASAQVTIAQKTIQLEVAKTPDQQAIGLMYRSSIPDDRGMLFPFNPARRVGFWMKNVSVNLDMVFLRDGRVEAIEANVPPCTAEPCPTYGPNVKIDQVIELRGGRAKELGLKVGDRLEVQSP